MEKYIQISKKIIFSICLFWLLTYFSTAQTPSIVRNIRFPLWAELDAYPELTDAQNINEEPFDYPIRSIKEVAPFLISGMVYGWNFTYVPSDKQRNMEEYLEIEEIVPSSVLISGISYSSPWMQNNRFNCWVEYTRNNSQIQNYNLWSSIKNPVIHGVGYGDLKKGFDGLKDSAYDALKNAVREYYRAVIKNKPKEITGSVLIRDIPTIGISSGRYIFNLDFFLECGTIIEYSVY